MTPGTIPLLPRGVRLHHDRVRGCDVLLAPERALMLDDIGAAILARVDGQSPLAAIAEGLARDYNAPVDEIAGDIADFLGGLAEQRLVDLADG
jgi:pyrroloquinoline quinone biosynthesis protein D